MQNLYSLTEFIRLLKIRPMGFSALYLVPAGRSYDSTCKSLTATAHREGVTISAAKVLAVDPSNLATLEAVRVTVK